MCDTSNQNDPDNLLPEPVFDETEEQEEAEAEAGERGHEARGSPVDMSARRRPNLTRPRRPLGPLAPGAFS